MKVFKHMVLSLCEFIGVLFSMPTFRSMLYFEVIRFTLVNGFEHRLAEWELLPNGATLLFVYEFLLIGLTNLVQLSFCICVFILSYRVCKQIVEWSTYDKPCNTVAFPRKKDKANR